MIIGEYYDFKPVLNISEIDPMSYMRQCVDALVYRKILFCAIAFYHEKASGLPIVFRMCVYLKSLEVVHLFLTPLMKLHDVLHKCLVVAREPLTVHRVIHQLFGLRAYLTYVIVIESCNLETSLFTL